MDSLTFVCPQCGGPLPRQALWRTVVCKYCAAEVTRSEEVVRAARFREAYQRSQEGLAAGAIACGGQHYRILMPLAAGTSARVLLAERVGALPERSVLKIAHPDTPPDRLRREKQVLEALQADASAGAAYFTQRLPQVVALETTEEAPGDVHEVLVLRNPTGFWGSLADVRNHYPQGIDPRHAVWMWRRTLEVLSHVHDCGWAHGRLAPEHLLVHPRDHGVLIIGWAAARQYRAGSAPASASPARDLMQTAWTIRALLAQRDGDIEPAIPASTPAALAALLQRASEDSRWCATLGARGLDEELVSAARASFGPPRFIDFTPAPQP